MQNHVQLVVPLFVLGSSILEGAAIQCLECGALGLINDDAVDGGPCMVTNKGNIDTCTYELNGDEVGGTLRKGLLLNPDERKNIFQRNDSESTWTEVCYFVRGNFRGEDLVMRGCDALPTNRIIEPPPDNGTYYCLPGSTRLSFETEAGREDIQQSELCVCIHDYCNENYQEPSFARVLKPWVTRVVFALALLIIVSDLSI